MKPGRHIIPASQLNHQRTGPDPPCDLISIFLQYIDLRIGEVVFVQIGDVFKELKSSLVIKKKSGQPLLHALLRAELLSHIIKDGFLDLSTTNVNDTSFRVEARGRHCVSNVLSVLPHPMCDLRVDKGYVCYLT